MYLWRVPPKQHMQLQTVFDLLQTDLIVTPNGRLQIRQSDLNLPLVSESWIHSGIHVTRGMKGKVMQFSSPLNTHG